MVEHATRVGVVGAAGKMGRTIVQSLVENDAAEVCAAIEYAESPAIGSDVGETAGIGCNCGVSITSDLDKAAAASDVLIDFTRPSSTLATLEACVRAKTPIVIGTTGFSADEKAQIDQAASLIPVLMAANFSVGVNVLLNLLEKAAATLGEDYDIEVVEAHHRHKVDSPSGTALAMGEALARGRGIGLEEAVFARHGDDGPRPRGVIGFQTVRGGDVVGEHMALFLGDGERLELGHRASSRFNFSRGAVRAALWVCGRPAGFYSMQDVLAETLSA